MVDQQPPAEGADFFEQARLRIMEHFLCSPEEATARLHHSLQALLEPIRPQQQPPAPPPPPSPPPPHIPEDEPAIPANKDLSFFDFDPDSTVPDRIPLSPSEYTVGKVKVLEYIELWYFTTEGRNDAGKVTTSVADDTYSFTSTAGSGLALQPIKASKASRNALIDECLSWDQIMTARHSFIATTNDVGWNPKLTIALSRFYMKLESSKSAGDDTRALILYHAATRRQWHDALKGRGKSFNISNFNKELYQKFEKHILVQDVEETKRQNVDLQRQASTCPFLSHFKPIC